VLINTTEAAARFRMPAFCGIWMLADAHTSTATAVVSAYKPSSDVRNAAQGGAGAWGPPV
jgi:exo-beta-1,3-glucanase (GH17 family)